MKNPEKEYAFDQYIEEQKAKGKLPLFYRYFEVYEDEIALDVENCNMVYSKFHQTHKHSIGFSTKKTALVKFDAEKIIYKLQ